jgi:hypothetical protein
MTVTKRTRFEVLKRDNHTCRYCGGTAPDVKLTVDHVTPVALGGGDEPSNLVAACRDCNAGKSSTPPDAGLVEDVKQADIRWAAAIKRVAAKRARQQKKVDRYTVEFRNAWESWKFGRYQDETADLPANWENSIARFYELGVPIEEITRFVNVACGNPKIGRWDAFRYFAGCVWRTVKEMQDEAKAILDGEASREPAVPDDEPIYQGYMRGYWLGYQSCRLGSMRADPLSQLVDHIDYGPEPYCVDHGSLIIPARCDPNDLYELERKLGRI